jgi:hypothetical protein
MVVEGKPDGAIPPKWLKAAKNVTSEQTLSDSLPHRSPEEQHQIASYFAGVTSWERIALAFGYDPATLPDTVSDVDAWITRTSEGAAGAKSTSA